VLALDREESARIPDGALDLASVTDDTRLAEKTLDGGGHEPRDPPRIESGEGAAVPAPPPEHRGPTEPRLRPFEDEELEEPPVAVQRDAPLPVMVGDLGLAAGPVTATPLQVQRQSV
jgi:hypothetical protein